MRLLVLTPAELTRDPRARRQIAAALAEGIEVNGLCGRISGEQPVPLPDVAVTRVGPEGATDAHWEAGLAARPDGPVRRELRGLYRLARLAARTFRLVRAGRELGRFDVVHANDLDTLPAARQLARSSRGRLVYDAHELYSGYEADPPRIARAVLLAIERRLARRADAVVTVSDALADELVRVLRLSEPPVVVLNAPELPTGPVVPGPPQDGPIRAIYQGAFGPGRPLAELLAVAEHAPGVRLTVRAPRMDLATARAEIERRGLAGRVEVVEPLPPDRLAEGLRDSEVGLVFDRPQSRNSELSLPNKLFEYLAAGLAVAAPALPGLERLVREEEVGVLAPPGRPDLLGEALERLAADRSALAAMRERAARAATERYNAAAQRSRLVRSWRG